MENIIKKNNDSICYETFGNKNDTPLLLVMGSMSSLLWWDKKLCLKLQKGGFYVIRYDLRDTGKSISYKKNTINYTLDDLASDAIFLLDFLGIKKSYIMGFSMGGFICQLLALTYPERINGLILIATKSFKENKIISNHLNLKTTESKKIKDIALNALKNWLIISQSDKKKKVRKHYLLTIKDIKRAASYESITNHLLIKDFTKLQNPENIKVKTLIFHGTKDYLISYEHAILLNKSIKNSILVPLEGYGHEVNESFYKLIIEKLIFFKKTSYLS